MNRVNFTNFNVSETNRSTRRFRLMLTTLLSFVLLGLVAPNLSFGQCAITSVRDNILSPIPNGGTYTVNLPAGECTSDLVIWVSTNGQCGDNQIAARIDANQQETVVGVGPFENGYSFGFDDLGPGSYFVEFSTFDFNFTLTIADVTGPTIVMAEANYVIPSCLDATELVYQFTAIDDCGAIDPAKLMFDDGGLGLPGPSIAGGGGTSQQFFINFANTPVALAPGFYVFSVWYDNDGDGIQDANESTFTAPVTVQDSDDIDQAVIGGSHNITIPACEDVYTGANFIFTVLDCEGVDINQLTFDGSGQFAGRTIGFIVGGNPSPNQVELGITIDGNFDVDIAEGNGGGNFILINYKGVTGSILVDARAQLVQPDEIIADDIDITIPDCVDAIPYLYSINIIGQCEAPDPADFVLLDGGAGLVPFFVNVSGNTLYLEWQGVAQNFFDGNTRAFFPALLHFGQPLDVEFPSILIHSSLNQAPTIQLPDNLSFRIPVCEDEIVERVAIQVCDDCDSAFENGTNSFPLAFLATQPVTFINPFTNGNCFYAELDLTLTEAQDLALLAIQVTDSDGATSYLDAEIRVVKEDVPNFEQLSCNPDAHITLSDDCSATIIPSMLLNVNSLCPEIEDAIKITAELKEAHHVANPNQPNVEGMGSIEVSTPGKYKYSITMGDDQCWGYFTIEDKSAPFCTPAGDKEPDTYVCGVLTEDPSGVDDLEDEYVSCVVIDKYGKPGIEPWFDVLEKDDFSDCSDMANIEFETTFEEFCGGEYEMDDAEAKQVPAGWEICMIFTRTWTAYDWKGNEVETPCSQRVKVLRPTRKNIHVKEYVTGECGHDDVNAYYPYFEDLGPGKTCPQTAGQKIFLEPGKTICKWNANVELGNEIELCSNLGEECSNSFKQVNEWTLVDLCSYDSYEVDQVYRFEDTTGPQLDINDVTIWTNPFDCTTSMTASFSATDYCSEVIGGSITAEYEIVDEHGHVIKTVKESVDGFTMTITDVPLEVEVTFTYSAWDCCGNMTTEDNDANSWDNRAPVCIANDELEIGLIPTDHDGVHTVGARIYPEDLDDTSKDNCFPLKMEIRKIYANGTVGDWSAYVEYSYDSEDDFNGDKCTDIQWVDLRVTEITKDGSLGLSTVCQSKLILRDNNAPKFISVGEDYSQNCFVHDYKFDAPEVWGFCLTSDDKDSIKEYHCPTEVDGYEDVIKTHTKTWTYTKMTEHDMKTISTSQTIYITSVRDEVFTLPYDVKLECTTDIPGAVSLDDILVNEGCSEWVMNVTEETYLGDAEACYKIIRVYDFINWCLFDENDLDDQDIVSKDDADHNGDGKLLAEDGDYQVVLETGDESVEDGRFRYVQIIKVVDNTTPTGSIAGKSACDPLYTDGSSEWSCAQGTAEFVVSYEDLCSTASISEWYVDGGGDFSRDGDIISAEGLAEGTYTLHVRLDDQCGNFAWISGSVEVGPECKKPTPVGLATFTALMENCQVDIWVSDIQSGSSYDNCTWYEDLRFGVELIGQDGLVSAEMPTAQSVTLEAAGTQFIALWVADLAGNTQYTLVPVTAVDNDGCGASDANVAGKIVNENDEDIDDVMVSAKGNDMTTISQIFSGTFNFSAIPMHTDVSISPEKNIGHLNGVSTADLVLLQRHVLGISQLSSAYKIIAADANNDTAIDTRDMLHISRLILGIYNELPNNNSWRFVAKGHNFANPTQPWGFPEAVDFADLSTDAQADFIGVKIGDLSGNALPSNLLGSDDTKVGKMNIAINDATIAAGETKTIAFTTSDFNDFAGYQFTIALDSRVQFDGIKAGGLEGVTDANFGLSAIENGVITTNWANVEGVSVKNGTVMFNLTVTATENVKVSDILNVNSAVTTAEAYNNNLDVYDVAVKFNRANAGFELFQNTPNPVSGETVIGFNLPTAGTATLKVMDVAGRTIKAVSGDYAKGYNTITLDKSDLNATGVLYYQLDTNDNSATKKMVILD